MSGAKVYMMFGGTESDSELPPITIGMPRSYSDDRRRVPSPVPFFDDEVHPAPETDDDRDERSDWPTTRRYARTLHGADSAFPRDPEYASAFDRFSDSFIEQDRERETLFRKWRPLLSSLALLALFALFAGIGVLLAIRG